MKVLNLVGIADAIRAESLPLTTFWDGTSTGKTLGQSGLPATFSSSYHQSAAGIKRSTLNLMLKKMLLDLGVEVREGWELVDIEETENSVTAVFANGRSVTGSFLVGCDGIKAASRNILLRKQGIREGAPIYTGLVQVSIPS